MTSNVEATSVGAGRQLVPWLYILSLGLPIAFIALALLQPWVPPETLFADPAETTGAHPLTGLVSTFSDMAWFGAGAVCLVAAATLRGRGAAFLVSAGALTLMLALDDFYLPHENVFPHMLGISERSVKLFYLAATGTRLLAFRGHIGSMRWAALALAGACFAASMVADNPAIGAHPTFLPPGIMFYVVEDGLKVLGILLWAAFHTEAALSLVGVRSPGRPIEP
jgi:hypothetical protein